MSLRLEMLQVARLAPALLGEEASRRIEDFVRSTERPEGGFGDREGKPDLYYTSFAVDALTALRAELPSGLISFLGSFDPATLDLVHVCALTRLASAISAQAAREPVMALEPLFGRIESHRSADGGYQSEPGADTGSAYACFLACGAYSDHHRLPQKPEGVARCLRALEQTGGGWANDRQFRIANIASTAAATAVYRLLRLPVPRGTEPFIRSCLHPAAGGFVPFPGAPLPDLLSTAVGLHTLDSVQAGLTYLREPCLDFIDTLWTAEGGFYGSWEDDTLDVEYTYYGLLALGHLSL
ncbi:MAG TPA: prenyltransferase/squalene oxidase repeat-containing protein [Verrucomicrobiales bacterium]|nr:prenyltransferase/squalene oxidase repeat-containing protein [Verrucomicrobiales bacterium]